MQLRKRLRALMDWIRYRNVDHFEIQWREPGGRAWNQVDDPDHLFDPSNLDEPIPPDHFQTHAATMGYYQGVYRLIPVNDKGRWEPAIWQREFHDGPSLEAERNREREKQVRLTEAVNNIQSRLDELTE